MAHQTTSGATPAQQRVLAKYQKPTDVTQAEAARLIQQINAEISAENSAALGGEKSVLRS